MNKSILFLLAFILVTSLAFTAKPTSEVKTDWLTKTKSFFTEDFSTLPKRINDVADKAADKLIEFFTGNAEESRSVGRTLIKKATKLESYSQSDALVLIGMIIVMLGLMATVFFGFNLLWVAFEEGFFWGLAIVGNLFSVFSQITGGVAGLLMLIPGLMTIYFVIAHWQEARKPVIYQLFSWNAALLGFLLIKVYS